VLRRAKSRTLGRLHQFNSFLGIRVFSLLSLLYGKKKIALANASEQLDGFGAQFQRVLSIAAFSKAMKLDFIFFPLRKIEIQHGDYVRNSSNYDDYLLRCNDWIRSRIVCTSDYSTSVTKSIEVKTLGELNLRLFLNCIRSILDRERLCFKIENAYFSTNASPNLYQKALRFNKNSAVRSQLQKPTVGIHLRLATLLPGSDRFLDPEVIFAILEELKSWSVNQGNIPQVFLYTDITLKRVRTSEVNSRVSSETMTLWKDLGIVDDSGIFSQDLEEYLGLLHSRLCRTYPELVIRDELEVTEVLNEIFYVDLFVGSKSSFSFLLALMARDSTVFMPKFWINPLPGWTTFKGLADSREVTKSFLKRFETD
jgi:hypothetical protein